jgi:hypothetical protein
MVAPSKLPLTGAAVAALVRPSAADPSTASTRIVLFIWCAPFLATGSFSHYDDPRTVPQSDASSRRKTSPRAPVIPQAKIQNKPDVCSARPRARYAEPPRGGPRGTKSRTRLHGPSLIDTAAPKARHHCRSGRHKRRLAMRSWRVRHGTRDTKLCARPAGIGSFFRDVFLYSRTPLSTGLFRH